MTPSHARSLLRPLGIELGPDVVGIHRTYFAIGLSDGPGVPLGTVWSVPLKHAAIVRAKTADDLLSLLTLPENFQ